MKIQLYIVQAPGGAKGDFLAGWLGSLPEFLNSYWNIDWETGQSFTAAKFLKGFSQDLSETKNLQQFLKTYDYVLDQNQDMFVCGTTHDPAIGQYVTQDIQHLVKIIEIQTSQSRSIELAWNFFVKTFLTKHRYRYAFETQITYGVDHYLQAQNIVPDDHQRLKCISNYLVNIPLDALPRLPLGDYVFDYDDLFVPDGSRLLARKLDLICSEKHHVQWNQNIEFSQSPLQIERFGKIFTYNEFRDRAQNQMLRHL